MCVLSFVATSRTSVRAHALFRKVHRARMTAPCGGECMHFFAGRGFAGTLTSLLSREHHLAPHLADAQKPSADGAARVQWRVAY